MSGQKSKRLCSLTAVREEATGRWLEFRGGGPFPPRSSKKISFTRPWLRFLHVSHGSGRGFPARFRRGFRSRRGSFAV